MRARSFGNHLLFKVTLLSLLLFLLISCKEEKVIINDNVQPKKYVLLLGASVGEAWDFPNLSSRLSKPNYKFEFIAKFDPDKSDIINEVLGKAKNKPDFLIIKQCAAYFRSDVDNYDPIYTKGLKQMASKWIDQCIEKNVVPILATVVPITEEMPTWSKIKRLIKKYVFRKKIPPYYRNIRLDGICDYNDWVRSYAKETGLTILDFESSLRISDENRYLNPEFTTDGLHINEKAYDVLDKITIQALAKLK